MKPDTTMGETLSDQRETLRRDILWFSSRANSLQRPLSVEESTPLFDALAGRVLAYQRDVIPAYGALVEALGASIDDWRVAPLIPTALFSEMDLCSLPESPADKVFITSGTTSKGVSPGRRRVPDLSLYDSCMANPFIRHVLGGRTEPVRWVSLIPHATILPHSSLSHMITGLSEAIARETIWAFDTDGLDLDAAREGLEEGLGLGDEPVILLATSFALAELLEGLPRRLRLPRGSRVMVTGGFKGKRKVIDTKEMYELIKYKLGVNADHIVDEYGMTELSSQAWGHPLDPNPTLRLRIVNAETGENVATGERGLVACFDLLNLDNVSAVLTNDIGSLDELGRLSLHGRMPGAVARGCSLSAEEIIAKAARR